MAYKDRTADYTARLNSLSWYRFRGFVGTSGVAWLFQFVFIIWV